MFLEMGFSEISGNFVQSAGWNMDALHTTGSPCCTMQDTFYLEDPAKHRNRAESIGTMGRNPRARDGNDLIWVGGNFDKDESQRALLRTHTTVNTVRHIAENPSSPSRVFGVGRVLQTRDDRPDPPSRIPPDRGDHT